MTGATGVVKASPPRRAPDPDDRDPTSRPAVVSDLPIFLVTDQGLGTGIGAYALSLLRLLQPAFPRAELLSLAYLEEGDRPPGVRRLQGLRTVRRRAEVPWVRRQNRRTLRLALPADAAVHDCGPDYAVARMFSRSVATVHDYYPRKPSIDSLRQPIVLARDVLSLASYVTLPAQVRGSRAVVVPTRHVQRRLRSEGGVESVVIPHWVDLLRFHPRDRGEARRRLGLPAVSQLALNVGAGTSNKNPALLRRLARALPPGFTLVKVGAPLSPAEPQLLHIPSLSHDDYPLLFNACNVYVHPSLEEGFGRPLIEAIASELPILALDSDVAREVAGETARYLPRTATSSEWICGIREATEAGVTPEVRAAAKERQDVFSPEAALRAYTDLYRRAFDL